MPISEMEGGGGGGGGSRYMSNEIMSIQSVIGRRRKGCGTKGDDQRIVSKWSGTFLHIRVNLVNNIISQRAPFRGEHER